MHAFGIVLVKPGEDVAGEVARLLAPFSENSEAYAALDPDDESGAHRAFWWDWYRIGGRWDGTIRGLEYASAPGCRCAPDGFMDSDSSDCHYGETHCQLGRNVVPVIEMGECRPFTLVTPEGEVRHRQRFVPAPEKDWPWKIEDDPGFDRWCGEQLLAHRECLAVGVDYHD